MNHNWESRQMLILAVYQVTGRGEGISMEDIKLMDNKTLNATFKEFNELKTLNSRRKII